MRCLEDALVACSRRNSARAVLLVGLVLAAALAVACGDGGSDRPADDAGATDGADTGGDADVAPPRDGTPFEAGSPWARGLAVTESPASPLAFFVEYETGEQVATDVEVDCGPEWRPVLRGDTPQREHHALILGLWEGATCEVRAWAVDDEGRPGYASQAIEVGALPDSLPTLDVVTSEPGRLAPGWTLFNLSNQFDGVLPQIVVVDPQGRYRWTYRRATTWAGADIDTHLWGDEGVLIGGNVGVPRPIIATWGGDVLWEGDFDMHHEIQPWGEAGHVLYLTQVRCDDGEISDLVVERETEPPGNIVWSWRLCDHYTPDPVFPDWSHTNTVAAFPDGESVLVSSRNQNSLLKVDLETGDVIWRLGFAGRPQDGFRGDFTMAPEDRFYQQHAPEVLSDGHIVVFDNGMDGVRAYSRAIEIAVDEEAGSAEVVWEYRHDPDLFAATWSEADRLPNGNTLVAFGVRSAVDQAHLVEATPESTTVWDVVLSRRWSLYRAERIAPLVGRVLP